ncbi:MAG: hypothetical protein ACPGD8_08365 [Flavobacteriales bacterium]
MKISLKTALLANATFSSLSGIGMLLFSNWLSEIMGITNKWVLPVIGSGLILFAITIVYNATRPSISANQVKLIIAQDLAWVIGSLVVIIFGLFNLTTIGYLLVGVVTVAVADFAWLQWIGLKRQSIGWE